MKIPRIASPFRLIASAATVAALAITPIGGQAQEKYPDRPIRMLVGFAAGGPTDVVARKLAQRMGSVLGQTIVVENKPGASTTIAATELVRAKPDGYTLFFNGSSALTITPLSIPGLTYDVSKDMTPIALVAAEHLAIGVHPSVPARSLKELAAVVKANPGKYSFASSGTGNVGHLTGELFNLQAGKLDMPHIAYKGAGPAVLDVVAGHVPVIAAGLGSMYEQHKAGKLIVVAVTDPKRSTVAKEIPTSAEQGFPNLVTTSTFVLLAPAGTPAAILATLSGAVQKVMSDEGFRGELREAVVEPVTDSTPAKTKAAVDGELKQWADLVKSTGISLN